MQILHPGDLVLARQRRWRVVDVRAHEGCQLIALVGVGPSDVGLKCSLLAPFDTIERVERSSALRLVRRGKWRRAARAMLANAGPAEGLKVTAQARLDVLPHQLEPALAILRGHGSRLLIADEVGLGKTIQAGIAVAELRARGVADRVLILTPAGLRGQWAGELSDRFNIAADVVDFRHVRSRIAGLPAGMNPWTTWPVAIASVDYVKRPEIVPAVLEPLWDVLVVDEAHASAGDSDRRRAVEAIAARASYVILLTATPHNGDPVAFQSLCDVGSQRDNLLIFRRTRAAAGFPVNRRVHRTIVHQSDAERSMHAALARFSEAVRQERHDSPREMWLGLAVLHKRALSSPYSLAQSVARRLATLTDAPADKQLLLPLDGLGDTDAADATPEWTLALALHDPTRERGLLESIARAARAATKHDTKVAALRRLLRRVNEPAIVFTEFRDTLVHVAAELHQPCVLLHGGLGANERAAALATFSSGHATLLLTTDAAGEGLNLHHTCRLVINLELPWNPMRLEQRIGRVDRIGQRRRVHVFHLIAHDTGEYRLLERLRERIARAGQAIGAPDPLATTNDDEQAAKYVIAGTDARPRASRLSIALATEADADAEAARLTALRSLAARQSPVAEVPDWSCGGWVTRARHRLTRSRLGPHVLLLWELAIEDGSGRSIAQTALALRIWTSPPAMFRDRRTLTALVKAIDDRGAAALEAAATEWRLDTFGVARAFIERRLARDRAIAIAVAKQTAIFQPTLFDRRADRVRAASDASAQAASADLARRIVYLERSLELSAARPKLRLAIVP